MVILAVASAALVSLWVIPAAAEPDVAPRKSVTIVIDDFGNDMLGSKEMMELPAPFTAAVMPFLPTTRRDAEWAHRLGHEVLVHMPMEPVRGKKSWLGPGAITTDLSDEEIRRRVMAAVEDVPYAVGMNNHMGSKVTADERVMRVILQVCKEKNLVYLDSRTTAKSVVESVAKELGVRTAENHIFMDSIYSRRHIAKQAAKVKKHLSKHDETVVIGHVGPPGKNTAAVLRQLIPDLQQAARFTPVSELAK
ncbi:divergent polysaccharide deacetylase family protein [Paenibacillus xerothermodurans]|uniref:Divergent polysaccharide deacetylase family protein n=1 Tax=Paenibacillus xerothermodurans TaxID=1977292 RepID=A0A2W1N829_PAEXE|nr:divergent polysaccharide deacetylase family protein [Paenibacillus xerothermodurans]